MSNARRESIPVATYSVKLHNRRVRGGLMEDGTITWTFRSLDADRTISQQRIRLSREAMGAMGEIIRRVCEDADREGDQ